MTLDDLRLEIDAVDDQLAALFARRMELADQVARAKRESGGPVFQPGREEAILARLDRNIEPQWQCALHALYAAIFSLSRARQQALLEQEEAR